MQKFLRVLILGLVFTSILPVAQAYTDLPADSEVSRAVTFLIENKVMEDGEKFEMNKTVSRADFLSWVVKSQGRDFSAYKTKYYFLDVQRRDAFAPYVSLAKELGALGDQKDYFYPEKRVQRLEGLQWIMSLEGMSAPPVLSGDCIFSDLKNDSIACGIATKAVSLTLADPMSPKNFGGNLRLTREEAALWVYRIMLMNSTYFEEGDGGSTADPATDGLNLSQQVLNIIKNDYYKKDEINDSDLDTGSVDGMVKALGDPYSIYQAPTQSQDFQDSLSGGFEGIGAYMNINEKGELMVLSPIKGSPAEEAGIKSGDIITAVDGKAASSFTSPQEMIAAIKGKAGTQVSIKISRDGVEKTFSVTRRKITLPVLDVERRGDTAILKLYEFTDNLDTEFKKAVEQIHTWGTTRMVIDVRDNPGGYLDKAGDVLDYFIPRDEYLFRLDFASGNEIIYASSGEGEFAKVPLVILQNNMSASASEVITLTLKENGAKVVGEKSFGKGTAQRIYPLAGGGALKLSVAKWLSAEGTSINGVGIIPDTEVVDNPETPVDEALEKALEVVKRM